MLDALLDGLIWYFALIPIIAIHEFGHAWAADKCGDPTARSLGRVTINPIAHMDMLGTVILPLLIIFLGAMESSLAGLIIGWGKPVPVYHSNLKNPRRDAVLVALAGPFMNLILAIIAVIVIRLSLSFDTEIALDTARIIAQLSLFLMFFNLLPIPPLDGSYLLKFVTGMSELTYQSIARYGFIILIVSLQIPAIQFGLQYATLNTLGFLLQLCGVPVR